MPESTHYVIVVHGTFAAPVTGTSQWHQLDETDPLNFCRLLNDRLEAAGLGRAIERSFNGAPIRFHWSGANDHAARIEAAQALHHLITRLMAQDRSARVHLIAHSHGGNVVLKALELYRTDIVNAACGWYWGLSWPTDPQRFDQIDEAMERLDTRGLEFADALLALSSDPEINQIGRVVFLGTPFYGKEWRIERWGWLRMFARSIVNALHAAMLLYAGLVFLYAGGWLARGMEAVRGLLFSRSQAIALPNLDVFSWRPESVLYFLAFAAIASILATRSEMRRRRRNVPNVYFDETTLAELLMRPPAEVAAAQPRVDALNITMGLLDEALLALSTEPLVYGVLAPRIRAFFQHREPITHDPIGDDRADLAGVITELTGWIMMKSWRVTAGVRRLAWRATAFVHRPALNLLVGAAESFVLRVISSAAFGVPPQEFAGSRITVKATVDVPAYFDEVHHDVAPLLQSADAAHNERPANTTVLARYAYLHDDRLLDALAARSTLCTALEEVRPHLAARYRGYPDAGGPILPGIRRVAVTVEQRVADLATGLAHVRYYSMPDVLDAIARFIVTGQSQAGDATKSTGDSPSR